MATPLFPSLCPRYVDPNWFQVDKPLDEEMQLTLMEKEHCSQMSEITSRDQDLLPTGQSNNEFEEEEDDEDDNEDDDDDDDNEDDDDDEEIEVDEIHFNPDSPVNSPHF